MYVTRFFVLMTFLFSLSACAINPTGSTYFVETKGPYTLDAGDMVRISVYGDANLSANYNVGDDGTIAFPLVGAIDARGFTTQQIAVNISSALTNGYMRNPDVSVEVAQYRPFFIQGEVANSGIYPYVYGMSVRAAISTAGGFTDIADRSFVLIYRQEGEQMVKGKVDLDFPIYPSDTIVILDRWL